MFFKFCLFIDLRTLRVLGKNEAAGAIEAWK
jgi:hypothetical protein